LGGSSAGRLLVGFKSFAIDFLVILSLLMNLYSLYQSTKLGGELKVIGSQLDTLNRTLEKNTADLAAHMEAGEALPDEGVQCVQTDAASGGDRR